MAQRPALSLKRKYELYVEQEIESYKESVPRHVLLGIGDLAVAALGAQAQLALTEMLLCEEVDRIIFRRLGLPGYQTWRKRTLKREAENQRPERWGLRPDDVLVRTLRPNTEARVLVAGPPEEAQALYLAAIGCEVTTVSTDAELVEGVLAAASEAGLAERVHGCVADLASWSPDSELTAVVVMPLALAGLSATQRAKVIATLQGATACGGVHLVQAIARGRKGATLDELRSRYEGWRTSVDLAGGASNTFLAWKDVS